MSTLKPLTILQKKAVRLICFSEVNAHSSPLFLKLEILKLSDLIFLQNALFMHDFHADVLPPVFRDFFYITRLASKISYYISKIRTNYGKFNIRLKGTQIWNAIQDGIKPEIRNNFKKLLKQSILSTYRKIPIIGLGAYFWSKDLFEKIFLGGGAYIRGGGLYSGGLIHGPIFAF